jgi:Asp-tRNAAsn/Glu-tRNAGln amidotransferase A subunit and related amidases
MTSVVMSRAQLAAGSMSEAEMFQDVLARIAADQKYMAWAWTYGSYEEAMERRWRGRRESQPLTGLPLGVKDIFNSVTGTTEMGSPSWHGHHAGNDARVVAEFVYRGAVVVGKTTTAEFAVHALPPTLNPWNPDATPGTSSSGSAVAVALGHVPIALATQTAGSITRPASFTGVIGFKPTQGVYPRTGVLKTCDPFDTIGFLCRYLEDVEPVFEATRVRGSDYPFVERGLRAASARAADPRKLRIARIQTPFTRHEEPAITGAVDGFVASLPKDRFEIVDLDLTSLLADADRLHEQIYHKALSYYFKPERDAGDDFSPIMRDIFEAGDQVSAETYRANLEALPTLRAAFAAATANVDLICVASTATTAPPRGVAELPDTSRYWTMLHLPTISLPLFVHGENSMPFAVQVVGVQKFAEPVLFRFLADAGLDSSCLKCFR